MRGWLYGSSIQLHILETPEQMIWVEDLQRMVWPGSETEIVPGHLLLTAAHNGGVLIGAFEYQQSAIDETEPENYLLDPSALVGFVFGFPGLYTTPDGARLKHCSHMLGVHPAHQNRGIGFALKRAQWQMVRSQDIDLITWTYDPLLSRNARLNISLLGAVCNTYLPNEYGELRDGLNASQPTDRFQVDWWVNSQRVIHRLDQARRASLDLAHCLAAGAQIANPTRLDTHQLPVPCENPDLPGSGVDMPATLLVEIPADYQSVKKADFELAKAWRQHTQEIFTKTFQAGYLVTDFVYLPGTNPRSFYLLSYGESTL